MMAEQSRLSRYIVDLPVGSVMKLRRQGPNPASTKEFEIRSVAATVDGQVVGGERKNADQGRVSVYAVYKNKRVEGEFHPQKGERTGKVVITSEPWRGQPFRSVSEAAAAVIHHYSPDVVPNCNGWRFWRLTSSGELINVLRRQ
ncbi:hypothetical protein [Marinitenerispora sediminis]|uniref:Uncharacterized protein n=1 Tax=Marinitenerispora sediminis TaxID=1931232 RepID=A0A368TBK2_9ACTN|nr:hypothetical protein [Marinitenerispora sediminis]RCV58158.1 hypothetical protein DEF28_00360 [Marinitenerispora sediminis]RCV61449.1 hypothetical protein DEF23_02175 [Marinitenerispora sediminis]RCV62529.1 hypothetical protein DEF24_00710 [Marinitenerispora sediminis]